MYELIPEEFQDLFPLGRLDINSEGLLLLTNDGQAYKELMNKEAEVEKEYIVTTWHPLTEELKKSFTEPFQLGPRTTLPAVFEKLDTFRFRVVLTEGINRHIRRICAKNENQVRQLVRVRFGKFVLGDLKPGDWLGVEGFIG
jgi:23S rRNA pseudouridine2604 synthase